MREVTPQYVKALFQQLVKVAGGVEPAAAFLNISHQRVSQLQSLNCADMPTFVQIANLQIAVESDLMTDAASRLVAGVEASRDLGRESREAMHAVCDLDRAVHNGAPPKAINDLLATAQRELGDVAHARAVND